MTQEMTSFVLRFVREVSEEQGARWRGLIQHVQSGAERNFATFSDAVQFMQGRVLENTIETLEEGKRMNEKSPLAEMANEMTRMWGDLAPQMTGLWVQTMAQMIDQSTSVRSQAEQTVGTLLKAWGLSSTTDQNKILAGLDRLNGQIDTLVARVEELEEKVAAQQSKNKTGGQK